MRLSPLRRLAAACATWIFFAGLAALAQQSMTVATLSAFIKSAIDLKNPDKDVAETVSKTRLTERFTLADLGELQSAGVGPKTLVALAALVTKSAGLPPPAKAVAVVKATGPPDPPDAEKNRVLNNAGEWALDYVKSLPDFLCLEDTNRSGDNHFQPGSEGSWAHEDRVIEKLTFFDHKENYELFMHNDTAVVNKSSDSLGGARSTGEWASLLAEIFEPSSRTDFHWIGWATVRGKLTYEYRYVIERQYSQETVAHGDHEKIVTGIAGNLFIAKGANVVLRVTVTPDIPASFPVQDVNQTVDYDYQTIGDQTFLLPLKATVQMRDGQRGSRNDIRWLAYRKYSADAVLKFDDTDTPAPQ